MKSKFVKTLIVAPVLAFSSMAFAAQPMQLNADQMDGVTAGGISGGLAQAFAVGGQFAATQTAAFGTAAVLASRTFEVTTIRLVGTLSGASSASSSF